MYSYFRRFRSVGRIREWYAAKADRLTWNEEMYSPPPALRLPDYILFGGSREGLPFSYIKVDRYSRVRKTIIESKKKRKHLHKRRKARRYREYQKRTGNL